MKSSIVPWGSYIVAMVAFGAVIVADLQDKSPATISYALFGMVAITVLLIAWRMRERKK